MSDNFIPLSVPNLKGNELAYVTDAVTTEWVSTAGPYVTRFEEAVARFVGIDSAVACQSGTAGLHLALMLAGVTRDEMVIVPSLTFIAAVNPVKYIGAEPVFMDCDDSLCIDPLKLREFCEIQCDYDGKALVHRKTRRRIRAMVVVHVFGNMADMESLVEIARDYHLKIVEDSTEALGTRYETGSFAGQYAGCIGDVGVYSFNGNKIITTGGGGMIVSRDAELLGRARHLTTQAKSDPLYYTHDEVGYNYRMTNLQAALGFAQMEQLEGFIRIKRKHWQRYCEKLADFAGGRILPFREGIRSNCWFYSLLCDETALERDKLIEALAQKGIQTRPIWGLINEQKPYVGCEAYRLEAAPRYRRAVVNLPCSTGMAEEDVDRVVEAIRCEVQL